jgi:hypothetical protein
MKTFEEFTSEQPENVVGYFGKYMITSKQKPNEIFTKENGTILHLPSGTYEIKEIKYLVNK